MPKLTICIPTYGRESSLKDLCCEILKPIHERYRELVSICIRDNSIGLDGYDFEYIYNLFDFADYQLNDSNLEYHGNVLALYNLCQEGSYVWFFPDDDSYCLNSICRIIDSIISGELCADVILPPFSYTKRPTFISTSNLSTIFASDRDNNNTLANNISTSFDELLRHGRYPFIPLTSSFIFRKNTNRSTAKIISNNSTNAWLHEVLMLAIACRSSTVQIVCCSPYVYYPETFDANNKPAKSGMTIEYFHDNNIALKKLRSLIFYEKSLYDPRECWRESLLWLIQDKDESIAWTNDRQYSQHLAYQALLFSILNFDLWLFSLCICFLFLPSSLIKFIRRIKGSHRAFE